MAEPVGQKLREMRNAKNLSLDQVFQILHIRQRFLEALENDRWESLPSEVQGRGFLRLYAEFLGLDPQLVLAVRDGKAAFENDTDLPEDDALTETEPLFLADQPSYPERKEADPSLGIESTPENDMNISSVSSAGAEAETITSQAIFSRIGASLRRRREMISLSMEDVEQQLHIRMAYLRALEAGRVNELPSLAQGKGMMVNYARFLELDTEALSTDFAEALQLRRLENEDRSPQQRRASTTFKKANSFRRLLTPDLLFGSLGILLLAAIIIWTAARVTAVRTQQQAATAPSIMEVLRTTPSLTPQEDADLTPIPTLVEDAQAAVVDENVDSEPTTIPTRDEKPIQVYIIALQRAWVRVSEDGKETFNSRIIPGNVYQFSAKDKVELVTGNAAGLKVLFNHKEIGVLGIPNQPASLEFRQEGVIVPTPQFTLTPTATTVPTATAQPTATSVTPTVTPFIP